MDRTERFYKIDQMIHDRRLVPFVDLMAALEVSRATLKRDLEYMRNRLNAPIVWDRDAGGYRFDTPHPDGSTAAIHNFDNRSDRYVIPHKELFLGHFNYTPRNTRKVITLTAEQALGNFDERLQALSQEQAVAEAKRCMSCGMCFECDNCVVYCPQVAVFKVPKGKSTMGRYVDTDYTRCIGCHICKDVCPTGYIQMGLGE